MHKMKINKEEVYSSSKRLVGEILGSNDGPTVIVISGIHGNEKAGVKATEKVLHKIGENRIPFKGNAYFLLGNIPALNGNERFQEVDLNRIWTRERLEAIHNDSMLIDADTREQIELFNLIRSIVRNNKGPFYFLDLHTTSSHSVPFITISDSLNNRKFSSHFPMAVVLGIEEYLEGPLLTFVNDHGHIALGFEGGQHDDPQSVLNCESFIWKALVHSNCLDKAAVPGFEQHEKHLSGLCCSHQFFEITYRHAIEKRDGFVMESGFENFEPVQKNQVLAKKDGRNIRAQDSGRIFMPLYQEQGEDGFFILRKVSNFWMKASKVARRLRINQILRFVPGIQMVRGNPYLLIVDPKVARFMAKDIFHLFGYRQQIYKDNLLHFIKRDRKVTDLD